MNTEHESQARSHRQVGEYLAELFDEPYLDPQTSHFYVGYGTTVLEVSVEPYGPEDSYILVTAYCVQGIEVSEGLLRGLLQLNHQLPVGAFSLVGRDVFYSYGIFGKALNRKNLLGAIAAVATVADDWDDRLVAKYGGQTALQRIRDTGGRHKRRQSQ